jgi:D-glycero-alpha-D-manno-heptose 1-phosphate guanylyltransferase
MGGPGSVRRRWPGGMNPRLSAVILCGGLGTRLSPVVADRPKAMAPVGGRPFLAWLLLDLARAGITDVVLASGHLGGMIEAEFGDGRELGVRISHSQEDRPLGTGGAVRRAMASVGTRTALVLNGDSHCVTDYSRLAATHLEQRAPATLWVVPDSTSSAVGRLKVDAAGAVTGFTEKGAAATGGFVNAGRYMLQAEAVLSGLPEDTASSLERDLFPALVGRGLCAVVGSPPLMDIGTPDAYARASADLARLHAITGMAPAE